MKVLILGSEGFIGSHLVSYFLSEKIDVSGCDLSESSFQPYQYYKTSLLSVDIEQIFENNHFDVCINAAGSGNVAYSLTHPISDFEANCTGTIHILEAIRRLDPTCRYLHISSAAVYGNPINLPVSEDQECIPVSTYGYHKLISEIICREYHDIYKIPIAIIRPFSVYGPGQKKQLLWDMCNKIQSAGKIKLFGTGRESRDFIHIRDMAKLTHCVIRSGNFEGDIINVASGTETTIREIADIFNAYYRNGKEIVFSGEVREGDPMNWRANLSKSTLIGFNPSIELKEGIIEYIHWFEQYINVR